VSRAAVVASLLPAWPDEDEVRADPAAQRVLAGLRAEFTEGEDEYRAWFVRSLGVLGNPALARAQIQAAVARGETTGGNAYGYERAFRWSPDEKTVELITRLASLRAHVEPAPVLLDPFAGGGSIPFEAARFGCSALASELNPVAAGILNATVDLPAVHGPDFAEHIKNWGARWCERVGERLGPFFPHVEPDERLAYIWAHTVPCPTTGHPTPLAPDLWLARGKADRDVAVRLDADSETGAIAREVVEGEEAHAYGPRSTYKRGTGVSVFSGETFSGDYIRQRALAGEMTDLVHGHRAAVDAAQAAAVLFGADPTDAGEEAIAFVAAEVPSSRRSAGTIDDAAALLAETGLAASKSDARRLVDQGSVRANGQVLTTLDGLRDVTLLHGRYLLLRKGRRHHHLVEIFPGRG